MTVKLLSIHEPYRHMYQGTLRASSSENTDKEVELPFVFSDMSGRFSLGENDEMGWIHRKEISDQGLELVLSQIISTTSF